MKLASWPIKLTDPGEVLGCMHCVAMMAPGGSSEENALSRMERWWNQAWVLHAYSPDAVAEHFTEDAVLVVNGEVRARGVEAFVACLQALRTKDRDIRFELPLEETFVSGESIFGHCRVHIEISQRTFTEEVMASVKIRNGRIAFLNAISHAVG